MNGRLRITLVTAGASVLTAAITAFGTVAATGPSTSNEPDRAEIRSMIAHESPYVSDRKFILATLAENQASLQRIEKDIQDLKIDNAKRRR